jgi:hypothetical protein
MSLIVGVALGAAAVIGLISGDVLGMAASNGWTELGWGACAVILLFNTLVPRRRRTVTVVDEAAMADAPVADEPVAARHGAVAERESAADREPVAGRTAEDEELARGDEPTMVRRGEEPTVAQRGEAAPGTPRE